jgi:thioredoxin-like negative regulator of GroEL
MPLATTSALLAKAFRLHQAGSLTEAAALYKEVLRERPDDPAALNNLGALQLQTGAYAAAVGTLSALPRRLFLLRLLQETLELSRIGRADN